MSAQAFGLDIGRSFIKVVNIKFSGNKKILSAASSVQTPAGGVQSESPVDLEKIADSVKSAVEEAKIEEKKCNVSLTESQVVTRLITLPNLTDKELSAAIHWEAEQYIPLPIKDVSLAFEVVSRPQGNEVGDMSVLLVAVPKRVIEKYMNILKRAGLHPQALETESTALARALTKPTDAVTVIVSLGAISTEIVIASGDRVYFTRSIATGGATLTKAIMAEFSLPASQAEEYKQTYGIIEEKFSGKVAAVLKPILDILISEITKAIEFARSNLKDPQINRIVIAGGGAYLPGLVEFLAQRTSLEVSLGDAWADFVKEGLIMKMPGLGSVYTIATGLALRR